MKERKIGNYLSIIMMVIMMVGGVRIAILSLICEDKVFSSIENRELQQYKNPTRETLISGEWMKEYEVYSLHQVMNREWYTGEYFGVLDTVGVKERNGFVIGKENYILHINEDIMWTEEQLEDKYAHWNDLFIETMKKLNKVVSEKKAHLIVLQIPHKNDFCAEFYPDYYEKATKANLIRDSIVEDKLNALEISVVNTRDVLNEHADEYLYYKTDNHYTFRGAYYVYKKLLSFINEKHGQNLAYPEWEECNYFKTDGRSVGTYLKKIGDSGTNNCDYLEYIIPKDMPLYQQFESGEYVNQSIVEPGHNNYNAFWGAGANPVIKTNRDNLPKVLFLGLSYTNALEVMSVYNFDEVHSIDPREYTGNISEYIRSHDFDYVIVVRDDFYEGNSEYICTFF